MPDKPTLHLQETDYSCVPTCICMVLEAFGTIKTEEELRTLCDCTILFSTRAEVAVEALKSLGFINTRKYNLTFESLKDALEQGLFPIAFLRTRLNPKLSPEQHAVVVIKASDREIHLLDPVRGEITVSKAEFENEWRMMRGLTILIQQ